MRYFVSCVSLVIVGLSCIVHADSYFYTGDVTFLELSGKDCTGQNVGDRRPIELALEVNGKHITGFSEIKDANLGRIEGNNAHSLVLEYADPTIADGHEISLQGIKTPSLSGELRERKLKPDEEGCNWSRGEIAAKLMPRTAEAEAHLQGLPATFNTSREDHVAWRRDPIAYAEIARLSPEIIQAESAGSENFQLAVTLREQLQPLYEKTYGLDSIYLLVNLTARADIFEKLNKIEESSHLLEQALQLAEQRFPERVAVLAFNLGEKLEKLNRKDAALSAFSKAALADEKQYGADHPEVLADMERQGKLLESLRQQAQAVALYRRILSAREKNADTKAEDIEQARNNLARAQDPQAYANLQQLAEQLEQAKAENDLGKMVVLRQQMLSLAEKCYDSPSRYLADLLFNQADDLESLNRDQEALALYPKTLEVVEASYGKEVSKTASTLNNFAYLYNKLGRYQQALVLYQRTLSIREKVLGPDHASTATSLNNLASVYDSLGQYAQALPLYQRALTIREKVLGPEHALTLGSLNNLGFLYNNLGQFDKALPLYQRALMLSEKTLGAEHLNTAVSLNNLAALYSRLAQYDKALPLYQRAVAIREKGFGPDHHEVAISLNNLAALYNDLGLYDKALPLYQRALAIDEKALGRDHPATVPDLNGLAGIYQTLGQYDLALPLYQRALAIDENTQSTDQPDRSVSLNNLANLYQTLGQYDKALPFYQRALSIRETTYGPEHERTAASLNNLASIYETLGQYDKALPLYQRALRIWEKLFGAEHLLVATGLNNVALLYKMQEQYAQAIPLSERALAIYEKILGSGHEKTASALDALAGLYGNNGQTEKALPLFQRALSAREKIFGVAHPDTALGMSNLGAAYSHSGQFAQALTLYQRAYNAAQSAHVPDTLEFVQSNLGSFYAKHGNPSTAIFYLKQAVNTMQSIRSDSRGLDKSLQKSLLKKNEEVYKQLAHLLVTAGRLAEAQQVLAMLKEDEYFDFIRRDAKADTRGIRMSFSGAEKPYAERLDKLGNEGAALVDQLNALNKQAKLGLTPEQEQQRTQITKQLDAQTKQTQIVLDELPKQLPVAQQQQLAQQRTEQAALAGGVQQQLGQLGQGVTLIQYLLLGDKIQIILTDANQQIAREAPLGEAALYPKLVALRKALEDPRLDPRPLAQDLYKSLIAPIEADIRDSKTLMFSLDGALRYIPFAALYDGSQYLIERYPLSIYTAAAKNKLTAAATPQWKISGLGVTQAHPGFSALPGVKAELAGIIGKDGIPGETHLDQEFTAKQMQASLKQGDPVLHLASHFQFTPGTEADSYLLLGDGSHLSLKDIRQGDYPFGQLDLLTLSACATAMHGGQESNGKEVEGFGALAQNKGAKGVLATLWPIADASTAQLMQTLYRSRQQQHLNKAEALRQAQLSLLNGNSKTSVTQTGERGAERLAGNSTTASDAPHFETREGAPFAHPYYWAPFILMGNWL